MLFRKAEKSDSLFIAMCLEDILALHAKGREDIFKGCGGKYTAYYTANTFPSAENTGGRTAMWTVYQK